MVLVRILLVFTIGILYGIFSKGITLENYGIAYLFGIGFGFLILSAIFAVIIFIISWLFRPKTQEILNSEQILDLEEILEIPKYNSLTLYTKYLLIVSIVLFVLLTLQTVVKPI